MSMPLQEQIPGRDQPDGQLACQALQGDEVAFEELVRRYHFPLFHFIYHLLGDYDRSCDVLQQVIVQLYLSLPRLNQEQSFKSWLFKVAHNRSIDELRKKRSVPFSEWEPGDVDETELTTLPDSAPLPQEMLEYRELQQTLRNAIEQLPVHYQDIVLLHSFWQLKFPEISERLGMPEATVKTYFHRAKRLLRATFQVEHAYELLPER